MFEFPAATTYTTPFATEAQIAWCRTSPLVLPQLRSSDPLPPRLRLATAMSLLGSASVRVAVAQSTPQMTLDHEPLPVLSRTRTAHRRAPGATPTTPRPLSSAPT